MRAVISLLSAASAFVMVAAIGHAQDAVNQQAKPSTVEAEPVLRVPTADYRRDWVQLGTFSVLADKPENGAKQLHAVYTARENLAAYLKDGKFPDGAVIVKDVWAAKTEPLTTGTASYAGDLAGRFVMIKDAAGKLGSGPRFGDGWGWAFYEGSETSKTVTADYKSACLTCHEPARKQDLLYLQGYPILKK
ncbi:MAG: cytochrome P460 family protein [Hyphomicrobium sp.]|jgi:hypothetical protein